MSLGPVLPWLTGAAAVASTISALDKPSTPKPPSAAEIAKEQTKQQQKMEEAAVLHPEITQSEATIESAEAQRRAAIQEARRRGGYMSTLLTPGSGLMGGTTVSRKTLLGA